MSFIEEIKTVIGEELYSNLNKLANGVFSQKSQVYSNTPIGQNSYIEEILPKLVIECELFENKNLKISPIDVINILYKCKLVKASKTLEDYNKKIVGYNLVDEFDFFIPWAERDNSEESLIQDYFERLKSFLKSNTLIVEISSFNGGSYEIQCFFDNLFKELNYPFRAYIDSVKICQEHKKLESLAEYDLEKAKNYFSSPSIGFTVYGSSLYCRWYSNIWLKSLISLLKIGGFIYPGQIEFGDNVAAIQAPNYPVFLGTASRGCFIWNEDKKEPLIKIPDGCLSRSFGNRSITKMWLDIRTFEYIKKFMLGNRPIFELLKNPWNKYIQNDITPTIDILSSTIHSTDIGAKILLVYCCLEHLFVPSNIKTNNRNYIIGGIYSLDRELIGWFDELYGYRCDYAHKGYIKGNEKILEFIQLSILNTLTLLRLKLNNAKK